MKLFRYIIFVYLLLLFSCDTQDRYTRKIDPSYKAQSYSLLSIASLKIPETDDIPENYSYSPFLAQKLETNRSLFFRFLDPFISVRGFQIYKNCLWGLSLGLNVEHFSKTDQPYGPLSREEVAINLMQISKKNEFSNVIQYGLYYSSLSDYTHFLQIRYENSFHINKKVFSWGIEPSVHLSTGFFESISGSELEKMDHQIDSLGNFVTVSPFFKIHIPHCNQFYLMAGYSYVFPIQLGWDLSFSQKSFHCKTGIDKNLVNRSNLLSLSLGLWGEYSFEETHLGFQKVNVDEETYGNPVPITNNLYRWNRKQSGVVNLPLVVRVPFSQMVVQLAYSARFRLARESLSQGDVLMWARERNYSSFLSKDYNLELPITIGFSYRPKRGKNSSITLVCETEGYDLYYYKIAKLPIDLIKLEANLTF